VGREPAISIERVIAAPCATVFGLLSDTNRWDRLIGTTPSRYTYELLDPNDPTSRTRIGHARLGVIPQHFAEEGEYWAGAFLRGERRFRGGFGKWLRRGFLELRCEPHGDRGEATRVRMRVGAEPTWIGWLMVPFMLVHMAILLRVYVRAASRVLARHADPAIDPGTPPAMAARRALLASTTGDSAAGPKTLPSAGFAERLERFSRAPIDDGVRRRVVELLRDQPDEAVTQVHPLEMATAWRVDGRQTIEAFLHATRCGLTELEWQIDCPSCRVGVEAVPRLDAIRGRIHCDECDISFDVDFAANVHATFTVHPAIRKVARVVYCATSPYFRPHIQGYASIAPGETRELGPLPDGDALLRARGTSRSITVERTSGGVAIVIDDNAITRVDEPTGEHVLRVTNRGRFPTRLEVERAGWRALRAHGGLICTIPGFTELFGTDAPATGLPLGIGRLAVLFTDLVGSVDLYSKVGDARAFALVHEHWRDANAAIAARGGAVIKTLGDGVFASFTRIGDAVSAAIDIMSAGERLSREHQIPFGIRAGVHEGPCFLVRANDRLDLFGSTVNLAARLATTAGGQQLALLDSAAAQVRDVFERESCEVEHLMSRIRGLPGEFRIALMTRAGRGLSTGNVPRIERVRTGPVLALSSSPDLPIVHAKDPVAGD
jgi:class 3 adenylate cyclase